MPLHLRRSVLRALAVLRILYWQIFRPTTHGARAICLRGSGVGLEVCLVRLTYAAGWNLPGGGVDRGESYRDAAIRETREECGLNIAEPRLLGVYLNRTFANYDHIAVYVARDVVGEPVVQDSAEIAETRFFPVGALPIDLWAGHRRRINECLNGQPPADRW